MRVEDLDRFECEHLLGMIDGAKPLVKIRAVGDTNTILLGEVDPAGARQLAADLMMSAARAEYEMDLWTGLSALGFDGEVIAMIVTAVRGGEVERYKGGGS